MIYSCAGVAVWVSESEPSLEANCSLWLKESSNQWFKFDGTTWVEVPVSNHTHPTLGDINFTGTVSVGGSAGITGSRLIPGVGTLTFTKGILTGFTPV